MNPSYPTNQQVFPETEECLPSFYSPYNSQDNGILTISPPEQAAGSFCSNDTTYAVQSCIPSQQGVIIQPLHPTKFFYRPPNDFNHYYIDCKEISYDEVENLLNDKENIIQIRENECTFFYRQKCNNRFYRVSCEIISPLLVNNFLNNYILGIELQQNVIQERLAFTPDQKGYLEYYLIQYLSQYLLN